MRGDSASFAKVAMGATCCDWCEICDGCDGATWAMGYDGCDFCEGATGAIKLGKTVEIIYRTRIKQICQIITD